MKNKKSKKSLKIWFYILLGMIIIFGLNNIYLIYNIAILHSIENLLRLIVCIVIILFTLLFIFINFKVFLTTKKKYYIIMLVIGIILIGGLGFINFNFNLVYGKIDNISSSYTTYSLSLVTKIDNNVSEIKKIGDSKIGIINDHEIANGYKMGEEILKENKLSNSLEEYESFNEIIDDLKAGKIEYGFLPSNYVETFSTIEGYEKIGEELKTIYTKNKQEEQIVSTKSVTEPFTVLLMGVDSTEDDISKTTANGDSLMLVTFNPDNLTTTMVSIPRDSYVPIACMTGQRKNKITHAAWGGENCIIKTIQNFTGINIDYYVKINFTGIVSLVNSLNGIDVDVEYSFCEQNSKRQWGNQTVYVKKGLQTINGEQALAYARNRHPNPEYCSKEWTKYNSNDFIRGQHQQDIVKAILSKMKNIRDLDTFYKLLDTISKNMDTNMEKNQILSFYNIAKDIVAKSKEVNTIDELINIQRLYISGYDASIYDYSQLTNQGMRMRLYNFVPYTGSIKDVVNAMKINLGLETERPIKSFSFDINNEYTPEILGKGSYSEARIELVYDLTGKTKSYAETYASSHDIKLTTIYEDSTAKEGTIINQNINPYMDWDNVDKKKGLIITVAKKGSSTAFSFKACLTDEKLKNDSRCKMDDFVGKDIANVDLLKNKFKELGIQLVEKVISEKDNYKPGEVISQSIKAGTEFYNYKGSKTLTIERIEKKVVATSGN